MLHICGEIGYVGNYIHNYLDIHTCTLNHVVQSNSIDCLIVYCNIFTLPVFSATINIRKILTFNFR